MYVACFGQFNSDSTCTKPASAKYFAAAAKTVLTHLQPAAGITVASMVTILTCLLSGNLNQKGTQASTLDRRGWVTPIRWSGNSAYADWSVFWIPFAIRFASNKLKIHTLREHGFGAREIMIAYQLNNWNHSFPGTVQKSIDSVDLHATERKQWWLMQGLRLRGHARPWIFYP